MRAYTWVVSPCVNDLLGPLAAQRRLRPRSRAHLPARTTRQRALLPAARRPAQRPRGSATHRRVLGTGPAGARTSGEPLPTAPLRLVSLARRRGARGEGLAAPRTDLQVTCLVLMAVGSEDRRAAAASSSPSCRRRRLGLGPAHPAGPRHAGARRRLRAARCGRRQETSPPS